MICPTCKTALKPLLTSWYCPNDCDKKVAAPKIGMAGLIFAHTFSYEDVKNKHRPCKKAWCSVNVMPAKNGQCPLCGGIIMKLTQRPTKNRLIAWCDGTDSLSASHIWEFWQ